MLGAKQNLEQITTTDKEMADIEKLKRFYAENSNLHFELEVKKVLKECGALVEHSGHYIDPFEGKVREYDFVANLGKGKLGYVEDRNLQSEFERVYLCVEAKNLSEHSPLIVGCVRREYLEVVVINTNRSKYASFQLKKSIYLGHNCGSDIIDIIGVEMLQATLFEKGILKDEYRKTKDGDMFIKWSQCVNSTIYKTLHIISRDFDIFQYPPDKDCYFYAAPVLVVPNGTLFKAESGNDGCNISPATCLPYKLDIKHSIDKNDIAISVMYIVTLDGLKSLVHGLIGSYQN